MTIINQITQWYTRAKQNKWYRWFAVFCRITLALGFIPSDGVKLMGERFTALPGNHPLGHYFDALHQTGFYYTSIGIGQLLAALLLLIPRTALLGALLYFPIILNICILTYATRFEGTRITTFMVLANLFLLVWHSDRLKYLFQSSALTPATEKKPSDNKFPFVFFGSVFVTLALVVVINQHIYNIRPGNSLEECTNGCAGNPGACEFCDCIYNQGKGLDSCLKVYEVAKKAK
ncbi:DoxX family protein [Emticicia sp. C21]|uniref:DoxX family protein n=1 Tax=Emticicia sp. C21 TaxID=2302915 RepID=UPI000E34070A|nr:DoxX family protein [Emticicia sp. C21]RFS17074.1 DoxX family protein [Emticicia sp. C21]